jgi:hypothetical protein
VNFELPLWTRSRSNARDHWSHRHKRTKLERATTALICCDLAGFPLPAAVRLVRVGVRPLDDDNLRDSLKAVRDELAKILGLPNDADPRVSWWYGQERGPYCVRIEVRHFEAPAPL